MLKSLHFKFSFVIIPASVTAMRGRVALMNVAHERVDAEKHGAENGAHAKVQTREK